MDYYFSNITWPKTAKKKKKRFSGTIKFHGSMSESSQDEDGNSSTSCKNKRYEKWKQEENNHSPLKKSRLQNVIQQHNHQASYSDFDDRELFYFDLSGHRSPSIVSNRVKLENNERIDQLHHKLDAVINIANEYDEKLEKNKTGNKRKNNGSLDDTNTLQFDDPLPKKKFNNSINESAGTNMDFSDIIEIVENINVENTDKESDNQIVKRSKKKKKKSIKAEPKEYVEIESSEIINNYFEHKNVFLNFEQSIPNTTKEVTTIKQEISENQKSNNFAGSSTDSGISSPVLNNATTAIIKEYFEDIDSDMEYDLLVRNIREKCYLEATTDPYNDVIAALECLEVLVPFEIPRLHRVVCRPSQPSKHEFDVIKNANIPIKMGRFTKDENDKIITNWNNFLEFHELDVAPTAFFQLPKTWSLENRLNFLRFIAHGLDDRLLHRVHARFKLIFNKFNTQFGRFSEAEDKLIVNYASKFKRSQRPFARLSKMLNRDNKLIIKRYDMLTALEKSERIKWNIEKESELVNVIMKVTKLDEVKYLETVVITDRMWKKISKKMNNIPISKLKIVWRVKIHPRLFAYGNVDLNEVKRIIVKRVYKSRINDIKLMDWEPISKECYNLNGYKLYQMLMHLVHKYVPKEIHTNLRGSMKYLRKILKEEVISTPHKFPKYVYKNGKLEVKSRKKIE